MTKKLILCCFLTADISGAKVTVDVGECVQCDNSDSSAATNLSLPVITVSQLLNIIFVMAAQEYNY